MEKRTFKEIYSLSYDEQTEYSLPCWYNRLIDKTYEQLDLRDVFSMVINDICPRTILIDVEFYKSASCYMIRDLVKKYKNITFVVVSLMEFPADLGKLFVKKFIGSYAREFDKQCLTANNSPFTGALATNRAKSVVIKGNTISDLKWEDFRDAVYEVPAEERKNCCWFLHETVVNHVMNLKDANGNSIVRRPMEKMPGVIDLYPYHECHVMPQLSEIGVNKPFAVFMNPQRISHGNRKGIELKRFDQTTDSMKFGINALRFRKRDAFSLVIPKNHMVILRTKPSA